jgi:hypothetical protein
MCMQNKQPTQLALNKSSQKLSDSPTYYFPQSFPKTVTLYGIAYSRLVVVIAQNFVGTAGRYLSLL